MAAVSAPERPSTLPPLGSIRGVLFDIDGTLCDSDPLHYQAFRDSLAERGFNGGAPITREFFDEHISGGHNSVLGRQLWPDWPQVGPALSVHMSCKACTPHAHRVAASYGSPD